MIKLWVGNCPTDCHCIEERDISDCAKNNDGTVTPGVFLSDAEMDGLTAKLMAECAKAREDHHEPQV